jgi:ADP-ribose pyrophosphatase YjhB (NUDIX family)
MVFVPPQRIVTVDAAIFNGRGALLLVERGTEPFAGRWALPGGFLEPGETVEQAVVREVQEETNAIWPEDFQLALLRVFSAPERDPRGPTISVAFLGFVTDTVHVRGGDDARRAMWIDNWDKTPLAFDHQEIARYAWASTGLLRSPVSTPMGQIDTIVQEQPGPHRIRIEQPESIAEAFDLDSSGRIKLVPIHRKRLRELYEGKGNHVDPHNPTMLRLREKGMVELQWRSVPGKELQEPHWTITFLGRAAIST